MCLATEVGRFFLKQIIHYKIAYLVGRSSYLKKIKLKFKNHSKNKLNSSADTHETKIQEKSK
jgi:hypothetical protein